MDPYKSYELLKKMRSGEAVTCPVCGKGTMITKGDPKTTHCFQCDTCKKKWNID